MAFDQSTRTRLQRFVSEARTLLTEECTRQLQHEYGMNPATGEVVELSRLPPLDDTRWETARLLRDTLAHYLATSPSGGRTEALQRIVREQAFTVLNRLVALRMMEARGLLLESIARGYQSRGFQLYQRLAGASLGETGDAYRCYLLSLFDEFALDLAVLFDRFSPQGRLFPREAALLALLNLLNHPDIEALWAEDETIGWIYQYYNSQEERRQMRADSPAPRNSRELAVRNQFFTPRYVVEFLTDNTLGRLWYEMTQGRTALTEQCRYLVRRPNEIFLQPGEEPPAQEEPQKELSQEELLQQPVHIPFRALKDPRDIRMLDPACGSMHFGLYAFDLFEVIYDEAWEIAHGSDEAQKSSASFVSFVVQYPDKAAFLADVPRFIIEHNLHGIDIDPRAVQIAGLSLWLRAQRTWQQQGLRPQDRPDIRRSNVVCAEPMPGEEAFLEEFIEAHLSATPEHKLLGQLVRRVFDAMKLAGEAGSLLKIEEEIASAVAEAKQKWLTDTKPEQGRLFADDIASSVQKERGLDVTGITDETFWEKAEEGIYVALQSYAEQAEHGGGYQRRLFANDAARGFAFIDLCRKRYDVVLMNPPFGEPPKQIRSLLATQYPNTKHDMFAAFTERMLSMLMAAGLIGQLSSRVCFFIKSFESWRRETVGRQSVVAIADLGFGVLDSAAVEAAAYIIENRPAKDDAITVVCRLLTDDQKAEALHECVFCSVDERRFIFRIKECDCLPLAPWVYWVSRETRKKLAAPERLEPEGALVRQGLGTGDNNRFIRALWEVPPSLMSTAPAQRTAFNHQFSHGKRWAPHVRSGSSQPWYSPLTVLIDWENHGLRLKEHWRSRGESPSRYIPSEDLYFRPGFSWTRRAFRLIPYVIPAGCIPSASRYMCFPNEGEESTVLGIAASNIASAFMRFYGEMFERPNHLVDTLKRLPYIACSPSLSQKLTTRIAEEVESRRRFFRNFEPFWDFVLPARIKQWSQDDSSNWDPFSLLGQSVELEVATSLRLTTKQLTELEFDLRQAVQVRRRSNSPHKDDDTEAEDDDSSCDTTEHGKTVDLVSYMLGTAFGRWDMRFATGEKPTPELPDPFAPLPVCPPGQLQNEHGLPITREDMTRLKEEGRWNYPIEIPWDGILADDPGHPLDLEARVHQVLQVIWKDRWEAIEREACEILGVRTLRDYFRKPADFFADHLKRYSKSRRKAPIYWPLQTPSGSYTLWLYYHRLNDQTLYTCVNDFVEKSKLHEVTEQLNVLRTKTDRSKEEEKKLDHLLDFEQELKDFRDELLRVAKFWKPNLNDGVQITAAPLWKLFQHKPWQKTLKDTWDKLEKGDYDWAHLAYSIWPDRVRDKCRHDKSLAIAQGLEDLYEAPPEQPKKKRGRARG